jgi:preprotein translocase subunit SecA
MIEAMKEEVVGFLFNVEVKVEDSKVEAKGVTEKSQSENLTYSSPSEDGTATSSASGVSRNSPCPCGSGKKYKRCHGASE